jgi:hypothetical protein
MTQATWSRIENGHTSITVEHLRLAASKLGHMPGEILTMVDTTATMTQFSGVEVVPTRNDERLKAALVLIGVAAIAGFVTAAVMKTAQQR